MFSINTIRKGIGIAFIVLLAFSVTAIAQDEEAMKKWEAFDFSKRLLTGDQLKNVSLEELPFIRGIVFGRHGRTFRDRLIETYLAKRPWYKPDPNFRNSMLNETERANLDLIREAEAEKHSYIEPGDMRWWQTRAFSAEKLGDHSRAEWTILRAEIEAIHGQRFDDQPWLQQYFEDRYWYKPDPNYNSKSLSETEWDNIATINEAQKLQRNVAISPGDMEHFQSAEITDKMLEGLSIYELRLIRNELYARRGRRFKTEWLSRYFLDQPWYQPVEDSSEPVLSPMERKNVDTIVKYETRLKESLSTNAVSKALLDGLYLEDARKLRDEIYAHHGKVFKDKWRNNYFRSFAWYKPNPGYSDQALTSIERKNVAAILAYEKEAASEASAVEG
jgi:hypothetical protein